MTDEGRTTPIPPLPATHYALARIPPTKNPSRKRSYFWGVMGKGGWILAQPKDGGIYLFSGVAHSGFFSRVRHSSATVVTTTTLSATVPTTLPMMTLNTIKMRSDTTSAALSIRWLSR